MLCIAFDVSHYDKTSPALLNYANKTILVPNNPRQHLSLGDGRRDHGHRIKLLMFKLLLSALRVRC